LLANGVEPGDEVITTTFSFIASANCILHAGAKPVLCDIEPQTNSIDPEQLESKITPRTKAVIAVDVFGHPALWHEIESVCARRGIPLIEDSAESIGARYRGRSTGGFGQTGIFAFYPNKQVTTGEGGALVTNDARIASLARSLRNQGRGEGGGWLSHERVGFNYRLSEINSALGRAQLQRLPEILASRARVAGRYTELLANVDGVNAPGVHGDVEMSWFVYVVQLDERFDRTQRDHVLGELRSNGIGCNNYFPCIHLEPVYRDEWGYGEGDFPVAESISQRTIALPFHGNLSDSEIEEVIGVLDSSVGAL
jgi:perosamine synthetase